MDSFLMKKKFTFTTVYNKDKRVVRRCCDGEENVHRREKKFWLMQLIYQTSG